jgi:hypothetical protein
MDGCKAGIFLIDLLAVFPNVYHNQKVLEFIILAAQVLTFKLMNG